MTATVNSITCFHQPLTLMLTDKGGQRSLLDALDIARNRLSAKDTADLVALFKNGGSLIG